MAISTYLSIITVNVNRVFRSKHRVIGFYNMVTLSSTKEARIYNGKKIASLTSGAGKIGQPLVKE